MLIFIKSSGGQGCREWCSEGHPGSKVALDSEANGAAVGTEARISRPQSRTEIWVIPVYEATILAQEALAVITGAPHISKEDRP